MIEKWEKCAKRVDNLTVVHDGDKGTIGMGYNSIAITPTEMGEEGFILRPGLKRLCHF